MIILGIDPGLASTGWGVIESDGIRFKLIAYGVVETKSTQEHPVRLLEIYNKILLSKKRRFKMDAVKIAALFIIFIMVFSAVATFIAYVL